tara:strand:+ start:33789 stop:35225 length:1437 start_codon:yes stop_codon:yes gene_type:complete
MGKIALIASLTIAFLTGAIGFAAEETAAPKERPFKPSLVASVKNSQHVYNVISKNKWFLDFRQSPLYYGLLYDLYPTLFSLPDEFSASKDSTWSGRLIDYVYESALKNRPVQVFYYQQPRLSSPWGISVSGLSGPESKAIDQLIKLFKMGDDKDINLSDGTTGKISLIEIKAQKWAVKKDGSCFSIGKDPKVVFAMSRDCKPVKINSDLEVDVNLSMVFPGLMMVREKVIGLSESMKVPFQWNNGENRFDLAPIAMGLNKDNIFVNKKVANELLKILPSDSHFFVIGNIKIWNGAMTVNSVKNFLTSTKRAKDFQKQAAAVLLQIPVKVGDKLEAENALIIETGAINQAQLDGIGKVFETKFGEVFTRPVCGKSLVVSRSKDVLQKIQNVCDRKLPSILDRSELKASELALQENSMSFFADVGKWMSSKIEQGYLSKAKQAKLPPTMPEELTKSQKLLDQLPKYLVKGSAKDQNLILK